MQSHLPGDHTITYVYLLKCERKPSLAAAGEVFLSLKMNLQNVSFSYGPQQVLQNIDLELKPGKLYGLVGANGAGKTTLLSLMAGAILPSSGTVEGFERPGLLLQGCSLYNSASGHKNLELFCAEAKVSPNKIPYVLDLLQISEQYRQMPFQNYSQGYKQRLLIARSLLLPSPIVLLDEPFTAVDIATVALIKQALQTIATEQQKCVLVSSHQLRELEQLVASLLVLYKGKLLEFPLAAFANKPRLFVRVQQPEEWLKQLTAIPTSSKLHQKLLIVELSGSFKETDFFAFAAKHELGWEWVSRMPPLDYLYQLTIKDEAPAA